MADSAELEALIAIAEAEAAARISAAVQGAQIAANATTQSAAIQADADRAVATTTSNAQKEISRTNALADVQVAGLSQGGVLGVADRNLVGTQYSSDKQLTGVTYSQDSESERLQRTLNFAEDKWRQVWPLVEKFLQNPSAGQGGSSISWEGLLSAIGVAPHISAGGVWTPSQIQAQLNAVYARADQKSTTLFHDAQIDLAGRGFGGASPILDMLRFSYEAENLESSTETAQQLALQAAVANAERLLSQQQARSEQYQANERSFTDLDRIGVELVTGTFEAVARIVSSIAR